MSDNDAIRKQLGGMPTGEYRMADMQFSVREFKPEPPQEEPSTVSEYDLWNGSITVCATGFSTALPAVQPQPTHLIAVDGQWRWAIDPARHADPEPFRELEEAVERWIKREGL